MGTRIREAERFPCLCVLVCPESTAHPQIPVLRQQGLRDPASWVLIAPSPQQFGLYSAFMGCFVYLFLGTSRDVTLGPTAIMSLLVASYAFREPAYAVLLAFLSGCVQLAMRFLGLGETGLPAVGVVRLWFRSELRHLPSGDALPSAFFSLHLEGYPSKGGVGVLSSA